MRWLIAFLIVSSSALAETVTTTNVLPNLPAFTTSGSTTSAGSARGCSAGEFCTGNATAGGGTYASTFDVPLTEDEVRRGFTLNSAVTVDSHQSNATLATCTSVTQVGDCRDLFTLGITLLDGGTVAKEFTHEVELDFTGERLLTCRHRQQRPPWLLRLPHRLRPSRRHHRKLCLFKLICLRLQ